MRPCPEAPISSASAGANAVVLPLHRGSAHAEQELAYGRRLRVDADASTLEISSPDGQVELTLRSTPEGCVLSFSQLHVALAAPGKLDLSCGELRVAAERRLELHSGGDYSSRVAGNSSTQVSGSMETQAEELLLHSTRGDARILANDYVRLVGEKILLNSEHERSPTREQLEAFWNSLAV